ncbi:MAG: putative outer membrane protein pmp20 [Ramlibacter sp.]|nr:putative outer membrane protein pmp20 [Ramlibacter sp.]
MAVIVTPPAAVPVPATSTATPASLQIKSVEPAPAPAAQVIAAAPSPGRIAPADDGAAGTDNALGLAVSGSNGFAFAPSQLALADGDNGSHAFRAVVVDRRGVELISVQAQDLAFTNFGVTVAPDGRLPEQLQRTLRSAGFAGGLDRLRQAARDNLELEQSMTLSVAGVSLGLSLVYLLWLVRGGVLMGSYLSALPAWRILDPLPVLARPDEEADEDDEDLADGKVDGHNALRGFG